MIDTKPIQILQALRDHRVPFLVIGGHAVVFHGHVRATEDMDILYWRAADPDEHLLAALTSLHAGWIGDRIDPATGIEETFDLNANHFRQRHTMMLFTDLGYLDIFDFVPGLPEVDIAEPFRDAVEADGIKFASLSWLRRIKQAAGRPRDLEDLANLPEA
jgi:hypothetical protein